jgi:MFS family permease
MLVVLARILQGIGMGLGITILGSMIALIVPHEELLKGMNIYSLFSASTGALGPYIGMFLIFGDNFIPLFSTALIITIVGFILLIYMKVKIHLPVPEDIHTQKSGVPIYKSSAVFPALSGSFLALVNAGIVSYISLYAISIGIRNVGFFFLFNFVGLLISRVVLQRIINAISLSWIFVLVGIGLALMLVALTQFDTVFAWAIIAIIYGFLFNFMFTLLNTMALKNVPLSDKAAANAFLFVCLDFGFFLGGIIWGQVAGSYNLQTVFIFGAILITISQALSAVVIWEKQIKF